MKHFLYSILLLVICVTSSHAQELSVRDFREATNDLSARTKPRQDLNGNDCALVKVQIVATGVVFTGNVMGDVAFLNNEYWVYMTAGSKRLKVTHPSHLPLEVSFADYGISQLRGKTTYVLAILLGNTPKEVRQVRRYQRPTSGYLQTGLNAGTLMGIPFQAGAYISNVNVEAYYVMGMSSETVYLNYTDGTPSSEQKLKPSMLGLKVGYGIAVGSRLRITPQVGLGSLSVKSDDISTSALCATVSCRVDFALTGFMGLNLTPEGQFALSKKDVFNRLSDLSSKVKGWGTGGGVRLGVYFYF